MAATYRFKVLTPNKSEIDADVVSIVAPGEAGYLGVLANHAPLMTTLKTGELKVRFADNREVIYRVGSGILKVADNNAIVLTESIQEA